MHFISENKNNPVWFFSNYSLKNHNTFGFDIFARFACYILTKNELFLCLTDSRANDLPILILGGGSNIILRKNFNGLVLLIKLNGRKIIYEDEYAWYIEAGAGENWHDFVKWTIENKMPGLENLAFIPGTVGAAPVQNIGAYGVELDEYFLSLDAINIINKRKYKFNKKKCCFSYRDSFFKGAGRNKFIIISVRFRLPKLWKQNINYNEIANNYIIKNKKNFLNAKDIFNVIVSIRKSKLPDPIKIGNVGSFFKNPIISASHFNKIKLNESEIISYPQLNGKIKLSAAWLINRCGWKNRVLGKAAVYNKQSLILINCGNANALDILFLAESIQKDVNNRFGIKLEFEPELI